MILAATEGDCPSPLEWRIEFQREGGVKGVAQLLEVSSDGTVQAQDLRNGDSFARALDPSQTQKIENFLMQACPFESQKMTQTCADCFDYSMSIQMDEVTYRVKVRDTSIPEAMQPLIGYLSRLLQQMIAP
jgi:hypothetical protein